MVSHRSNQLSADFLADPKALERFCIERLNIAVVSVVIGCATRAAVFTVPLRGVDPVSSQ